jgi:hypothetical protein
LGIRHVFLFGPVPEWKSSLPKQLERYIQKNNLLSIPVRMNYGLEKYSNDIDLKLELIAKMSNSEYFSPLSSLCNIDGCLTYIEKGHKNLIAWDSGHLTNHGSSFLINSFKNSNAF